MVLDGTWTLDAFAAHVKDMERDLNVLYDFGWSCTFVGDCIVSDTEFVSGLERLEKKLLLDIEKIESALDQ